MIWLVVALMALVVILMVGLLQSVRFCIRDHQTDHAKCITHIASVVSARVIAITLRDLADTWGTIENQAELKRLVREQWIEDGPSIPALWLYEKARLIEEEGK